MAKISWQFKLRPDCTGSLNDFTFFNALVKLCQRKWAEEAKKERNNTQIPIFKIIQTVILAHFGRYNTIVSNFFHRISNLVLIS